MPIYGSINVERARPMDDATKAKARLQRALGFPFPPWLRGIGVGWLEDGSHCVQVNVSELSPDVRSRIPETVDGVPVRVSAVGEIGAR